MTTPVSSFLSAVNNPFVFIPEAACMHAAYLAKAKTDGFTYAPKRDNPNKKKPNILPWALLSRSVQASNVGPFESMFSYVAEQAVSRNFADLAELGAFVEGLLDADGNVPDPVLGERTWKVWVPYAREHEPSHPNLVDTYDQVDQGAKDYDFYLNGVAVKFLLSLIREQMAKDLTDAVAA